VESLRPDNPVRTAWKTAWLLVASLHLLTTPGTWLEMDQGEYLLSAERLVHRGTFTLAEVGEKMPWAGYARLDPRQPVRLRMQPAAALALAPLVALDEALGFGSPGTDGRLVHLQGHLFVLLALALLGLAIEVAGAGPSAAALAVAATGFAWPVWSASANGGAEPILMALCAAYLLGGELSRRGGERRGTWLRAVSLFLLPWAHASGPFVAAALVAGEAAFGLLRRPRELAWLSCAFVLGLGSMILLWNWGYHGNWWAGGYALANRHHLVGGRAFGPGLARYLWASIPDGPVPVLLAAWSLRARPWARQAALTVTLMAIILSVLFAQEPVYNPSRRLAVLWPAVGLAAAQGFDALAPGLLTSRLLLAASGLTSFYWFIEQSGRYYLGAGGLFYPAVLWVKQLIDTGPSVVTLAPPLTLLAALVAFSRRVDRVFQAG
jgi:hypothetical protein